MILLSPYVIISQFGKSTNGHITAQHVAILPTNNQQRFKEVQVKVSTRDRTLPEPCQAQISPSSRHAVKEILVCVSRGASPEKQSQQTIYHLQSSSDEDEQINFRWIRGDVSFGHLRERTTNILHVLHVMFALIILF